MTGTQYVLNQIQSIGTNQFTIVGTLSEQFLGHFLRDTLLCSCSSWPSKNLRVTTTNGAPGYPF